MHQFDYLNLMMTTDHKENFVEMQCYPGVHGMSTNFIATITSYGSPVSSDFQGIYESIFGEWIDHITRSQWILL